MKKLLLFFFLIAFCNLSIAQTRVKIDSTVNVSAYKQKTSETAFDYSEVVYLNMSKSELWSNLKSWVAGSFATKFVIDDEDKEVGRMILKYSQNEDVMGQTMSGILHSCLQIDVRDGKYRIRFFNQEVKLRLKDMNYSYFPKSVLQSFKEELAEVESISKTYFNSSMSWLLNLVADKWSDIGGTFFLMAAYRVDRMNIEIKESLKNAMSIKDDF